MTITDKLLNKTFDWNSESERLKLQDEVKEWIQKTEEALKSDCIPENLAAAAFIFTFNDIDVIIEEIPYPGIRELYSTLKNLCIQVLNKQPCPDSSTG
jgi:hypothetical protein